MRTASTRTLGGQTAILMAMVVTLLASPRVQAANDFDHSVFDALLKAHVRQGQVDYSAIKRTGVAALDRYLARVAEAKPDAFSRSARLAFYLNTYNALVIRAVVERLPLSSVQKVPGFFDKLRYRVAGRTLTLNELENQVIRKQFAEPRIHFALVCGAKSCPPLGDRAFQGKTLAARLEQLTRAFLNSRHGVTGQGPKVLVSKLFSWYAADFGKTSPAIRAFIARYNSQVATAGALDFLPYDWQLNGR
ncbi:MAG: DUF547 domain-containing protein [Deltaproteobacteria bacterium]|nr:DUF547 domain-containing protein [Deltaproteobacteria bacterium]